MVIAYKHNFNPRTIRKFRKVNDARHNKQLKVKMKESIDFIQESIAKLAPGSIANIIRNLKPSRIKKKGTGISIYFNKRGTLTITVNVDRRKHGKVFWVNDGTGIHGPHETPIVPRTANVLRIEFPDGTVFVQSTEGQRPQKFIERGVNRSKLIVATKIASVFN